MQLLKSKLIWSTVAASLLTEPTGPGSEPG